MARAPDQVLAGLLALPAEGWALPRDADSTWGRTLAPLAAELAQAEARAEALLDATDPRTPGDLLAEWERLAGLPDPCIIEPAGGASVGQRIGRVLQRLTRRRGARPADMVALAAGLGITVTITEHREHHCELGCEAPVAGPDWDWAWTVGAPATSVVDATCEDHCETPLRRWGDNALECFIRREAPPHLTVLFAYG